MNVSAETRRKLDQISAATSDRLLGPERKRLELKSRSGTKPGTLLKHQVEIRTFAEWDENMPGFAETDLVWVFEGLENIRQRLPFDSLGLDSDNGSEFINRHLIAYCKQHLDCYLLNRVSQLHLFGALLNQRHNRIQAALHRFCFK